MREAFMRYSKFRAAIIGAVALAGFSVLGARTSHAPAAPSAASLAARATSAPAPSTWPLAAPATSATTSDATVPGATDPTSPPDGTAPQPAHVVVVVVGNDSAKTLTPKNAPYITALGRHGARFSNAHAETHPSQPNYLALFAGSTHGVTGDGCPHEFASENLASELVTSGRTFTGYAESMPSDGYRGCADGLFTRTHAPWIDFTNVPASSSLRFKHFPTSDFAKLPTVSFVIPNLCDDMRKCSIATGDAWLKKNLSGYASWAKTHDSLLIVTFDEVPHAAESRIPLIVYGQGVKTGAYGRKVNHYSLLRTLEDMYGLACTAHACDATALTQALLSTSAEQR
jgi:acid phosphatase